MQSSLIGKIQKAHLYAREPDRVTFSSFTTTFRGDHDSYDVGYGDGHWSCSCHFFPGNGICQHIMAIQRILTPMLPSEAQYWPAAEPELAASAG
ncbi:MAG: hypothetical protein U0821_02845 [Chloroflexota bacterium]